MDRFIEELSNIAKVIVKDEPKPDIITVTGRAKEYNGKMYVQIDGSDQLTPIASSTVGIKTDDWVTVQIKNHSATVTGNATDPSPGTSYADEINDKVDDVSDQISEFEIVIADKVDTDQLNAVNGRIDNLVSENVTITGKLDAVEGEIDQLQADNVTITGKLDAVDADIDHLESSKAEISVLESQYATIENLEATNADIHNLEADYASFKQVTTEDISAINGSITNLEANKLDVESADILYAQIDFANIGIAAVEELFAKSGIIEDLVVSSGHITGELVGVTIKGDLIEGNTIKADKLVVLGSDGLYYKLNVNGESVAAEQTQYNSLNGSVITANTITAEKINVDDLVAFNATIGGFKLSNSSMYSGAKASVSNTTPGVYLGSDGQLSIGDQDQYLKFYKDATGAWKLEIAASAIKMGTTSVVDKFDEIENKVDASIKSSVEQFYLSSSPTALSGGSWSTSQPTWQDGKYIWRRTLITYQDGSTTYTPSANGVCITGNTGPQGDPGSDGTSVTITSTIVDYQASTSGTTPPTGNWTTSIPSVSAGSYLWTRTKVSYSDGKSTTSYSVSRQGSNGAPGAPGSDGTSVTITNTAVTYAASTNGMTAPSSGWQSTVPSVAQGSYLWTKTVVTYSDGKSTTSYSVSRQGADGSDGSDGVGIESSTITYQAGLSGTTPPTGTWSSSIPAILADQYLWTRTVTTYTDGTTTTAYSVSRMGQLTDTETGNVLSIGENAGKPLRSLTVYGNTRQNLWQNPSGTNSGITATANADGSITLSGTSTAYAIVGVDAFTLRKSATYTIAINEAVSAGAAFRVRLYNGSTWVTDVVSGVTTAAKTFTMPDNDTYDRVRFAVIAPVGTTVSGTYRVMLNEGSTAQPWCPPGLNGVDELSVVCAGKNLLDMSSYDGKNSSGITTKVNDDGSVTLSGTLSGNQAVSLGNIGLGCALPPGDYIFSGLEDTDNVYVQLNRNSSTVFGGTNNFRQFTVTEEDGIYDSPFWFIGVKPGFSGTKTIKVQLEIGSKATDWVSPAPITTTPIDLSGHTLNSLPDGTRDELSVDATGAVTLTKRTWMQTIDGTDLAQNYTSNTDGCTIWDDVLEYHSVDSNGSTEWYSDGIALGDVLPTLNSAFAKAIVGFSGTSYSATTRKNLYVNAPSDSPTDYNGARAWLNANPLTIIYKLATPQTISLGTISLPNLNPDHATVYASAPVAVDISGEYWTTAGTTVADAQISANEADQRVTDVREELQTEIDTSIEQVEGQIISTVEATYTTKDEFENEIATIGTQITQNQNSVNFQFSQLNGTLADLNSFMGTAGSQLETITKYIRFLNGDIVLGGTDSDVQLKIENDRIAFLDNNNEVMYITNEELYIMRAIIATQLTIGNFSWVPRSNGNVSFRYIGS